MAEVIKGDKTRKPKARDAEIVLAAMEERIGAMVRDDTNEWHFARLDVLMDELKRALNRRNGKQEEGE